MKTYVFLDLDDTLFQTRAKCGDDRSLEAAAFGRDGGPLSYMTARQREFFAGLARGTIIPTTARNLDAFRRVRLPFDGPFFDGLAILNFGGVVLSPTGELDRDWDALVRPQALAMGDELRRLQAEVQRFSDAHSLGAVARLIVDFDMPLYVVVKHPAGEAGALRTITESDVWPRHPAWFTHRNDNNLSLIPHFLGKERAVAHVIESYIDRPEALILGCADSDSDAPFLRLCDYAIVPPRSQLGRAMGVGPAPENNNGTPPTRAFNRCAGEGGSIS